MIDFYDEFNFEITAVIIDELKLIVVALYHSTAGNPKIVLDILDKFLFSISQWKTYVTVVTGDFNENFDVLKDKKTSKCFLNLLKQYNFYCYNFSPTRGKTSLDIFFC